MHFLDTVIGALPRYRFQLGEIGGPGYKYYEDGQEKLAHFPDSILITLDDASYKTNKINGKKLPTTFEIIIPESKRADLVALLNKGCGNIRI